MNKRRLGVNLTEVTVAVCVLGFSILPVMSLLNYSNRGTIEQEAESVAANLAKEEMNRLMFIIKSSQLGDGGVWSLGADYKLKRNCFNGVYEVKYFNNDELEFAVPKFNFHDPALCSGGEEKNPSSTYSAGSESSMPKRRVLSLTSPCLADIKLTVQYRLASEQQYDKRHTIVLYGRRALID